MEENAATRLSLAVLCRTLKHVAAGLAVEVTLFGSTVDHGQVVGDLDLWLDGEPEALEEVSRRFLWLGRELGMYVDLVRADEVDPPALDAAFRVRVREQGIVIQGMLPKLSSLTLIDVDQPFRDGASMEARAAAWEADVLARARFRAAAAEFAQTAVQCWLRSHTADLSSWRAVKRLSGDDLLRALERSDEELAFRFRRYGWSSELATDHLCILVESQQAPVTSRDRYEGEGRLLVGARSQHDLDRSHAGEERG